MEILNCAAILSMPLNPTYFGVLEQVLLVVVIFLVTAALARIAAGLVNRSIARLKDVLPPTTIFANLTKLAVYLIGVLIILQTLGIAITPILTALGVGGLAVALALQDTLGNLFAGLQITISRKIKPGDYIKVESGQEGYVKDITLRNVSIADLSGNLVILPNAKLSSAVVTNFYLPQKETAVLVDAGVAYGSDLKRVEAVTVDVARGVMREVAGGVAAFEPFIRYHTFSDSSINFTVILRAREFTDQYLIKHEFIKRLHDRYQKEGIEIPFPIRTVYMKQEAVRS